MEPFLLFVVVVVKLIKQGAVKLRVDRANRGEHKHHWTYEKEASKLWSHQPSSCCEIFTLGLLALV